MAMTPAALMKEKLIVKSEANDATTIGKVCDAGVSVNINANRNSFQLLRKVKSTTAISAGSASGTNTCVRA